MRGQRRRSGKPRSHGRYGEGSGRGSEHRVLKVGHILRPEYSRKLIRMITRVFR